MRIGASHPQVSQVLEQVLLAKAVAKLAQERPVERAEKDVRLPRADEPDRLPPFGEFLERENLEKVRVFDVETRVVEREVEREVVETDVRESAAPAGLLARDEGEEGVKYGAPRIGDVFTEAPEARGEKPESLRYNAGGKPVGRDTDGFIAVMIDVIA